MRGELLPNGLQFDKIILSSRTTTSIFDFNLSKDVVKLCASGLHHNLSEVHGEVL